LNLKIIKLLKPSIPIVSKDSLLPFALITFLFALWGFANDITNPMVAAFGTLMELSNAKAAWVQLAFYGGYATMAIPAALFVRHYSYKKGILLGLALYAIGALLFYPAAQYETFGFFLLSLYILTFGLAFLETTASPYIMAMGHPETATRRLNLAQAFNPFGSLLGMFIASNFILSQLQSDARDTSGKLLFNTLELTQKASIRSHDLEVISTPYIVLGFVVIAVFILILGAKMPKIGKAIQTTSATIVFKTTVEQSKLQRRSVGSDVLCRGPNYVLDFYHPICGCFGNSKSPSSKLQRFGYGNFSAQQICKYLFDELCKF
jgi:FHS family L-fucose permease-like MFS transporter